MTEKQNTQVHEVNKNPWLDMYITIIKIGFRDVKNGYMNLIAYYNKEFNCFICAKRRYQTFSKYENNYRHDLLFLLDFIENNPFNVDMLDVVTLYYDKYNITLQDLKKLGKLLFTCPLYIQDNGYLHLIRKGKQINGKTV